MLLLKDHIKLYGAPVSPDVILPRCQRGNLSLLQLLCEMVWHRSRWTDPVTTQHKVTLCQKEP